MCIGLRAAWSDLTMERCRGGGVGVSGYDLGGYVLPRFPNLDPVLKRISIVNDTPF